MVNGYVIKLITLKIYETLYFMCVWTCCCDHSSKVNAFTSFKDLFNSESKLFFEHSDNHGKQTYIFFDTVHLIKNIRNNLLHAKKFVFPEFSYNKNNTQLHCPQGYINWADLYNIYCKDEELT